MDLETLLQSVCGSSEAMLPPSDKPAERSALEQYEAVLHDMVLEEADEAQYRIENIVCTMYLGCELNLQDVRTRLQLPEGDGKFPSLIVPFAEPKCTLSLFSTGKMNCTGAKSEADARSGCHGMVQRLLSLGYKAVLSGFKIENIVCSCSMPAGVTVNLHKLATSAAHRSYSDYEPERFPGVTYRIVAIQPMVTSLVFMSGKFVITGCRSLQTLEEAFGYLVPLLYQYRRVRKRPACDSDTLLRNIPSDYGDLTLGLKTQAGLEAPSLGVMWQRDVEKENLHKRAKLEADKTRIAAQERSLEKLLNNSDMTDIMDMPEMPKMHDMNGGGDKEGATGNAFRDTEDMLLEELLLAGTPLSPMPFG